MIASASGEQHRPLSWTWLKLWCIAWWHSGRDDEDDDEEIAGQESSRTGAGYEETLTPLSAETPLPSTVSRCPSLSAIQTTGATLDKVAAFHEYKKSARPTDLKTISSDSVRYRRVVASLLPCIYQYHSSLIQSARTRMSRSILQPPPFSGLHHCDQVAE